MLGGGGSTGNAWLIGVLAGLADAGLDLSAPDLAPDLTVGTSAGATAAAQLGGATPAALYAAALRTPPTRSADPAVTGLATARTAARVAAAADQMERTRRIVEGAADPADMRRRLGASALALPATSDDALRRGGAQVVTMVPGDDAGHLFGANAMDLALRPEAARTGFAQGRAAAGEVGRLWTAPTPPTAVTSG